MARNFVNSTDRIHYNVEVPSIGDSLGAVAFWFRGTDTTAHAMTASHWTSGSRQGWAFLFEATGTKMRFLAYPNSSTPAVDITATSSIKDGAWHHVAVNYNRLSGQSNQIYIEGVQEASGNSNADWTIGTAQFFTLGDPFDAFWTTAKGDLAEVGHWTGGQLDAAEIAALAKGFSPKLIHPSLQNFYSHLDRDPYSERTTFIGSVTGTTAVDHPRIIE